MAAGMAPAQQCKVCVAIICVAGFFEMWAAGTLCQSIGTDNCTDELAWAAAAGAISTFICLVVTLLFACAPNLVEHANPFIAVFLFLLWFAGTAVLTFDSPFTDACTGRIRGHTWTKEELGWYGAANGYVACWICFFASFKYMTSAIPLLGQSAPSDHASEVKASASGSAVVVSPEAKQAKASWMVMPLFIFSLIEMAQASYDCTLSNGCTAVLIWGICCGVLSVVLSLVLLLVKQLAPHARFVYIFLTCMWGVSVATLTYQYKDNDDLGVFSNAGNGFFSTWAAFFCSFVMCYVSWVGGSETTDDGHDPTVFVALILLAGFFEMWAAGTLCDRIGTDNCKDQLAWAVAAGVLSTLVCLIMTVLFCCTTCGESLSPFVAVLLVLIWGAAVTVCTFDEPFTSACSYTLSSTESVSLGGGASGSAAPSPSPLPSGAGSANGYFACWICALCSLSYMYHAVPGCAYLGKCAASFAGGFFGPLLLASGVVVAQAAYSCSERSDGCTAVLGWALACGIISGAIALMLGLFTDHFKPCTKYIAIFLSLMWFVAIGTLTFRYKDNHDLGIYSTANNGFFGTWAAFFSAFVLCYTEWLGGDRVIMASESDPETKFETGKTGAIGAEGNART